MAMISASAPDAAHRLTAKFGDDTERATLAQVDMTLPAATLIGRVGDAVLFAEDVPEAGPDDLEAALTLVAVARRDLDALEKNIITAAREIGLSWETITKFLGKDDSELTRRHYHDLGKANRVS